MTALKKSLDRALSGVEFRPELKWQVLEAARPEGREDAKMRRKMSAALIFALIAALILAGVAVAAVITRGFGWYAAQYGESEPQYHNLSELEKRAESTVVEQTVSKADETGEAFRFEILQGYYDGSRADVTLSLRVLDRSADISWRPSAEELSKMDNIGELRGHLFGDGFEGVNEAFLRALQNHDACGVHVHDYYFTDGAWLPDGQHLTITSGDQDWAENQMTGYRNYDKLPKEARNKDSIQLIFHVKECDMYYYLDESDNFYYGQKQGRTFEMAPVTLKRGKGTTQTVSGTADFGQYAVWAEASVSPVGVKAEIWQRLPDEWVVADAWTRSEDLSGVDYVKDYQLYADGAQLEGSMNSEGTGVDEIKGEGFSGEKARFPDVFSADDPAKLYSYGCDFQGVPESTKELRLRPVYSISGECPAEDLVLKLADSP